MRRVLSEFAETQELSELVSPDLVWDMESWSAWSGQPVFHGREGFMQFFAEWTDAYEAWTNELESFIDAGDTQVVVTTVQRGRMRGSESWSSCERRSSTRSRMVSWCEVRSTEATPKLSKPPGAGNRRRHKRTSTLPAIRRTSPVSGFKYTPIGRRKVGVLGQSSDWPEARR